MLTSQNLSDLKATLDEAFFKFSNRGFIEEDPVLIPHLFQKKQDIEIAGYIAATFAWGQRKTIINKSKEFLSLMDNSPLEFVLNFQDSDEKQFHGFKHRTFNGMDAISFLKFFRKCYSKFESLEDMAFSNNSEDVKSGIIQIRESFIEFASPMERTLKHVQNPLKGSACKRINMFFRWMVRKDNDGVDFGIWKNLGPSNLICPLDIHVSRASYELGMIKKVTSDWNTAIEITNVLLELDPKDPIKYDIALFSLGRKLRKEGSVA